MVADHVLFLSLGVAAIIGSICLTILKWYMSVRYENRFGVFGMLGVFPGLIIWACMSGAVVVSIVVAAARTDMLTEWWFVVCACSALLVSARLTYAYRTPASSALHALGNAIS